MFFFFFFFLLSLSVYLILKAQSGRAFSKACVYLPWSWALDWAFFSTSHTVFYLWQGTVVKLSLKWPPLCCLLPFYQLIPLWYLLSVHSGFKKKKLFASNLYFFLIMYCVYTSPGSNPLFLFYFLIQIGTAFPVSCWVSCFAHGCSQWTKGLIITSMFYSSWCAF